MRHGVAIRPESICLSVAEQNGHGVGQIIERDLLGNIIRYRVSIHDMELRIDQLNLSKNAMFAVGTKVNLHIDNEQIRAL